MNDDNKYTNMQKKFYNHAYAAWSLDNPRYIVGDFDRLDNWDELNNTMMEFIGDTENKIALDFACGPGRNLVLFKDKFKRIDGVDISSQSLEHARSYCNHCGDNSEHQLFFCDGVSLSCIENDKYDAIITVNALHHICVHDIRFNYFKEFYRVLKPGGKISLTMAYGKPNVLEFSTDYYNNFYDAERTNSGMDVRTENPSQLKDDLDKIGYVNFKYKIISNLPPSPLDKDKQWTIDHRFPFMIVFSAEVDK